VLYSSIYSTIESNSFENCFTEEMHQALFPIEAKRGSRREMHHAIFSV